MKKNINLTNAKIKAKEVILIDENGKKKGLTSIDNALKYADNLNLDLVQVSPHESEPVVCKVLDYGKHLFSKKRIKTVT